MPAATGGWHQVLERAWQLGSKFDSWSECFHYEIWEQAMADCGVSASFYANRTRAYDEIFPWDHLDYLVEKSFLCAGKPDGTCFRNHTPLPCQMCRLRRKPENREGLLLKNIVRMRFAKTGRARYISHLDLIRCFQRAVCRAKLPAAYSEGFHPHMQTSFATTPAAGIFQHCGTNGLGTDRGAAL